MTAPIDPVMSIAAMKRLLLRNRLVTSEVSYGITPEDIWPIFRDANQGRTQRQSKLSEEILEKDWDIAQSIQTRTAAVTSAEWDIGPARGSSDSTAISIAEDIKEVVNGIQGNRDENFMTFPQLLTFLAGTAYLPGFSVAEIEWLPGGGDIEGFFGYPSWYFTHQDSSKPKVILENAFEGKPLDLNKFIIHEFLPRHSDPARGGLIRPLAWLFSFKNLTFKDLLRYVEKFGMPFVFGSVASGDDKVFAKEADKLMDVIENFGSDGGGVFSANTQMEFKDGTNSGGDIYYNFFDLVERKIQQIVLGQTSTSDSKNSNRSTAQVHDLVRHDLTKSDVRILETSINTYLIGPLTENRHGPDAPKPVFKYDVTSWDQTNLMLDAIIKANSAGYELEDVNELNRQAGMQFVKKETLPTPTASNE